MSNCLTKQRPEQLESSADSKLSQNFPPNKFPLNRQVLHIPKITSTRTTWQILHALLLQVRKTRMRTKLPSLGVSKHIKKQCCLDIIITTDNTNHNANLQPFIVK